MVRFIGEFFNGVTGDASSNVNILAQGGGGAK
jgi:hypothetical protein